MNDENVCKTFLEEQNERAKSSNFSLESAIANFNEDTSDDFGSSK